MPLELVTGPANAEKAGHVLAGVRDAAQAGLEPLLVVPRRRDVEAYRRELAGGGVALGITVTDFAGLLREMARRTGTSGRSLGELALERVASAVAAEQGPRLRTLGAAAATDGFPAALARLGSEISAARCDPARFALAMAIWGRAEGRRDFAADLATLNGAYAARLERLGAPEPEAHAWVVLDALRRRPQAWGTTPVFFYGFDDFTRVQLDAVETLSEHVGASLVVSLPFEARPAFAGRGEAWQALRELAGGSRVELPASDAHYAPAARRTLHGLERGLFEDEPERVPVGEAIELLEGGGPRAELELIAARVRRLLADGVAPQDIAIAVRDLRTAAPLVDEVFGEAGIAVAHELWIALPRTSLGRSLLALLRCALLGGGASDLLVWLRSPGGPGGSGRRVDTLEADIRERGLTGLDDALASWERLGGHELRAIERLREAAERGMGELYDALGREAARMLAAPHRAGGAGSAPMLDRAQRADAAAVRRVVRVLGDLRDLARRDPALAPDLPELHETLARVEVPVGDRERPGAVVVADPLSLRARRVRALFLGRLQEAVFPRPGRGEPFLGDHERRSIDAALANAGEAPLSLRSHEDPLDAERYQLYAAVSRPTDLLVLSWHRADEDGEPAVRSPFVDDVLDVLDPAPDPQDRRLGSVEWGEADDASPRQRELAAALRAGESRLREGREPVVRRALTDPGVLETLARRDAWSATELEVYERCPVRWLVERLLKPGTIDPDAVPLGRGTVVHEALERTLRELAERGERIHAGTLDEAAARVRVHLREVEARHPITSDPRRRVAEVARLEADLVRYLEYAAEVGSSFSPSEFELSFGGEQLPAVDLGGGLCVRGRVDRIDRDAGGGAALIIDYKGRTAPKPAERWLEEGLLQAGLYARALERLEQERGTRVVGALYQPIGADEDDMKARGFVEADADPGAGWKDRIDSEQRDAILDAILERSREVVAAIREGRLEARPERCSWNDTGCAYPSICRCEA
jgi:ATP-dependent helicase/DNAse subunit B